MKKEVVDLFKAGRVNEARIIHGEDLPSDGIFASKEAKQNFEHQNSFGPHHAFDNCGDDWKKYFLFHDALHNTLDDVVFSVFDRYLCQMGCPTCYLNSTWMSDEEFAPFVGEITPETETDILKCFTGFYRVGSIDDLRMIKTKYPQLFWFYEKHAPKMEHNITDNSFFSQFDIMMNDVHFAYTAYLSFSDYILDKNDGKIVDKIIPMLEALNKRSPIRKINFIMSNGFPTENPNVMRLFDWIVHNTKIETFFHTDLCKTADNVADLKAQFGYDLPSIYYQENNVDPVVVCQILTETVQLRGTKFFTTLTGSTMEPSGDPRITTPFYEFDDGWNPSDFVVGLLKGKIWTYDYYREIMTSKEGNRYWEYFNWCAEKVVVNGNYTFIPEPMLKPWSNLHKMLVETGQFVNTNAGLFRVGAEKVVPIVTFDKTHEWRG